MARLSELGIDFEHWCFACGRANPQGLHLDFEVSRDRAETRFVAKREHTGYDGALHGGIVTALLDETMGWTIFHQGIWAVTGRLSVTFRRPVLIGEELRVIGEVTKRTHRAIETRGEIRDAGEVVLAESDALFVIMPEERRRDLERRYGLARSTPAPGATGEDGRSQHTRFDETFAKVKAAVEAEEKHLEHGRT